MPHKVHCILFTIFLILSASVHAQEGVAPHTVLRWEALPDIPDPLGVAGPFAGAHSNALIIAGGANFPRPVWEHDKVWRDAIHVLTRDEDGYAWKDGGTLPVPTAYGMAVSTKGGIICMGGNDGVQALSSVHLLRWHPDTATVSIKPYPNLPKPCAYGQAALIGHTIFLAGGQTENGLESAMNQLWSLDLSKQTDPESFQWQVLPACPGPSRAFNLTISQHNGFTDCVYVMSGRRLQNGETLFLQDVWEFNPTTQSWRARADSPRPFMAGIGVAQGQSHIFVLGGDDGALWGQADTLKDTHPGFPRQAYAYHTITDAWSPVGDTPANHVTTIPVIWDEGMMVPSGEIRPRVRSPKLWRVTLQQVSRPFGALNYTMLFGYLAAMVGVGAYFARRNRNTDDFFRGGGHIPWWAAGCSIFATMLSSLTFTGVPSKAFAQDWVYLMGNFMIPVVAFVAVYVALPFYRRIDATSAYEYLEKRFNWIVRLFGSGSFTVFHVFRMAVVMSLTGSALAVATPLSPAQSVLLMGVLSILYCTMGGIEAVIWTDTIQTFVLLGGALVAIILLISGVDGGLGGFVSIADAGDKFRIANFHLDATSAQIAFWVIIVGSIGQNISSYTADQAVVQRYMTTQNQKLAARSIWTNACLSIPASLLFFGMGTALYAYYRCHPEKLDPTITTDQIFPMFIATEMPAGLAGLIVAGIFAAAQSTVSTSMNSTATTLVTDFLRPLNVRINKEKGERWYLNAARIVTLIMGVMGTLLGLVFVDPTIKSLFDEFIKVIGLFMGVLGGLFVLGVMTRRANGIGAVCGAVVGSGAMIYLWLHTSINGYLYTSCGIVTCFIVGYVVSLATGQQLKNIEGLTIYTLQKDDTVPV
jgi:solute:Na+ symporter, SSS family